MHAFLNTQKSIAVKTKCFIQNGCLCEQRNSLFVYRVGGRLSSPTPPVLCTLSSSRLYSRFIRATYSSCDPKSKECDSNVKRCTFQFSRVLPHSFVNHLGSNLVVVRHIRVGSQWYEKEPLKPSSKVEQTVQALKQDLKESEKPTLSSAEKLAPAKKTLGRKVIDELLHYYHGFRLLFIDINVSRKLLWRVLNGMHLTRREHRLLVRTVSDLFRLVPFSVFIVVPFMELLLPFFIKFFPGMLPSTFQTATEKEDKLKQSLKVKLEMAKFLQQTLDDMAVQRKGHVSDSAKQFADFFVKVRTSGEQATTEEIMKFSKLFEDEITLDSLSRPQLIALCRVLEMQTLGTNNFLRFQLRMKLRTLAADDKMIQKEGIDSLTPSELQQACRARGMRAYGVSEARLKSQLAQWLDLSLNHKLPPSLLLLSRALLLPDTIPATDQLKATISVLPDSVVAQTQAAIYEREGKVDNKTKIEVIKEEERKIREERQEMKEEQRKKRQVAEELLDKAPVLSAEKATETTLKPVVPEATQKLEVKAQQLTSTDLETLETALDSLGKDKKKLLVEKEELHDLKEELAEYQEDVNDLKQILKASRDPNIEFKESKAAQRLCKKVTSMIGKLDAVLTDLEREEQQLKKDLESKDTMEAKETARKSQQLVSIEELISAIKQIQKVPDDSLVERISEVLSKMDEDRDGAIRVEDVLKVVELVGKENVKLNKKQVDEIIELMSKEEIIELEEQIEKALEKQTLQRAAEEKKEAPETIKSKDTKSKDTKSKDINNKKGKNCPCESSLGTSTALPNARATASSSASPTTPNDKSCRKADNGSKNL